MNREEPSLPSGPSLDPVPASSYARRSKVWSSIDWCLFQLSADKQVDTSALNPRPNLASQSEMRRMGIRSLADGMPIPGTRVYKSGCKTGVTRGVVNGVTKSANIPGNGKLTTEWTILAEDGLQYFSRAGWGFWCSSGRHQWASTSNRVALRRGEFSLVPKDGSAGDRVQLFTYIIPICDVLASIKASTGLESEFKC